MTAAGTADRSALVESAREIIAEGSQSFAAASRLFERTTRERAWLLYSWCRTADDMTDGQYLGHDAKPGQDMIATQSELEALTAAALDGEEPVSPPFAALRQVARETRMPRSFIHDHITGFGMDARGWRPADVAELLRYCYHVAGTVGCMMAVVMGVDPADDDTLDRACDLGIAFQLANIARDILPDVMAGRCYLPQAWLSEHRLAEANISDIRHRRTISRFACRLVELASAYRMSARVGAARLPFRSRLAVLSADAVYGAIGEKVVSLGSEAWNERVHVSRAEKLYLIGLAVTRCFAAPPAYSREGLWTRPRQSFAGTGARN